MRYEIAIAPVALGRTRFNTVSKGRYLPPRSLAFRQEIREKVKEQGAIVLEGGLKVTLHFYKKCKVTARNYGDVDNHCKAVLDALNGLLWQDDSQVVELHAYKHNGAPKIEVEIENVD